MFTGLVEAVGSIERVERRSKGARITVRAGRLPLGKVRIGDSICVQGGCLTVVAKRGKTLQFDVSSTHVCIGGTHESLPTPSSNRSQSRAVPSAALSVSHTRHSTCASTQPLSAAGSV